MKEIPEPEGSSLDICMIKTHNLEWLAQEKKFKIFKTTLTDVQQAFKGKILIDSKEKVPKLYH